MTTIAAVVHDGIVHMAADSAGTDGSGRLWYRTRPKIARLAAGEQPVIIASSGPTSLNAFIAFHLKLDVAPSADDDDDCDRWAQAVAEAIASWAAEAKPTVLEESHLEASVLLGCAGRLWHVKAHHADRFVHPYAGIGSGGEFALGALAMAWPDIEAGRLAPATAVQRAVEIGSEWDAGTGGPIVYFSVE